jgi:hypothetical protein
MNVFTTTKNTNENVCPQLHPQGCDLDHQERKGNGLRSLTQGIPRGKDFLSSAVLLAFVIPWAIGVSFIADKMVLPAISSNIQEVK